VLFVFVAGLRPGHPRLDQHAEKDVDAQGANPAMTRKERRRDE
jgi:hypothetical protein